MPWSGTVRNASRPGWTTTSPSPSASKPFISPCRGGCPREPSVPCREEPDMTRSAALLEDATGIRMALQRLCVAGDRVEVAYKSQRAAYPLLTEDGDRLAFRMPFEDIGAWGLK